MATTVNPRPIEVEAFLATLADTPPDALTACERWTTHDLGAHLAGAFEEVVRHLRAWADGRPLTRTRSFEEREAPFKLLSPDKLLRAIQDGDEQMRAEIAGILADDPEATLTWTRRQMRVDSFLTHLRSECAIHRWDMVGDDETSWELLGSFDLFEHALTAIGAGPMTARGMTAGAGNDKSCVVRVSADGHPDLVVTVCSTPSLGLDQPAGDPTIVGDQPARLLFLWGRMPSPPGRLRLTGPVEDAFRAKRLLCGY